MDEGQNQSSGCFKMCEVGMAERRHETRDLSVATVGSSSLPRSLDWVGECTYQSQNVKGVVHFIECKFYVMRKIL